MKKGLRLIDRSRNLAVGNFNRRPDEEGIKTEVGVHGASPLYFNRRPDEEGIKTHLPVQVEHPVGFQPQT